MRPRSPRPRTPSRWARWWWVCLSTLSAPVVLGCALTERSEPVQPRYFSPERSAAIVRDPAAPPVLAAELRVGHVTAASYLDERMVFRDSAFELGYYQEKRWTEAPEEYLRRWLEKVLFEERGLRHVVGGAAPTLEVVLIAFEEIRKPKQIARVQVSVRLQDARAVRWEETLTVDQPVIHGKGEDGPDRMVEALGAALNEVVRRIADRVTRELTTPVAASSTKVQ